MIIWQSRTSEPCREDAWFNSQWEFDLVLSVGSFHHGTWYTHSLQACGGRKPCQALLPSFLSGQSSEEWPSSILSPPGKHVVFASLPLEHFCMLEMPGTLNKQKCVIHSTAIIFSILAGSSIWFSFGLFVCFLSLVLAHRRMLPTFYTFSLVEIISPSIAEHLLSHEWEKATAHYVATSLPHSGQLLTDVWNNAGRVSIGNDRVRTIILSHLSPSVLPVPMWTWL